jgi:protein-S-isoprenylcysteine O-methyltransferase Ste14
MLIKDHMSASGNHLFRWRSYLPMVFLPFIALTVQHGEVIEVQFGDLAGDIYEITAILLVVLGQAIRILTVGYVTDGTSGRNTTGQIAECLNVTGFYSVVRNPLYLGNCLMYLGVVAYSQNLTLTVVLALVLALYYERIISAEESFLAKKFGDSYAKWAAKTPAFFPHLRALSAWQRPALPFSWKMVIRREHPSIFGAIVAVFLIDLGFQKLGVLPEDDLGISLWILGIAAIATLAVKLLKRYTRVLEIAPRS